MDQLLFLPVQASKPVCSPAAAQLVGRIQPPLPLSLVHVLCVSLGRIFGPCISHLSVLDPMPRACKIGASVNTRFSEGWKNEPVHHLLAAVLAGLS